MCYFLFDNLVAMDIVFVLPSRCIALSSRDGGLKGTARDAHVHGYCMVVILLRLSTHVRYIVSLSMN